MAAISGLDASQIGFGRTGVNVGEVSLLGAATLFMLWPALYNGFPIIFSDTGTYISQAMELHLGWDRPPYYSFLIFALGWGQSLWPTAIVQCFLASWVIRRTQRMIAPRSGLKSGAFLLFALGFLTSLPWTAAQIMPDIFTPLMVLAFVNLALIGYSSGKDQRKLMAVIAVALLVHLSNLPIYCGLLLALLVFCGRRTPRTIWISLVLPLVCGLIGLVGVNVVAAGVLSPSPYGATFMLARLLSDGPALVTLQQDCVSRHWTLCKFQSDLHLTADQFLWTQDSPLYRAGGPIHLIAQTRQIVDATVEREPLTVLRNALRDTARQLITFAPGSGLRPWHKTAWQTIKRDMPPHESAAYRGSLQAQRRFAVGRRLQATVYIATITGIVATAVFLLWIFASSLRLSATQRKSLFDDRLYASSLFVFLALIGNAMITGALSGPHDRYQSRVVWLAVLTGALVMSRCYASWRSRPTSSTA